MEGYVGTLDPVYLQEIHSRLVTLVMNGISLVKENAVTALASTVEQAKEAYIPYFADSVNLLNECLRNYQAKEYKQFRGQVIEAITIICAGVGEQTFFTKADEVIQTMLHIQNSQLETKDAQRVYLLSAWQRICLLMKGKFSVYLP